MRESGIINNVAIYIVTYIDCFEGVSPTIETRVFTDAQEANNAVECGKLRMLDCAMANFNDWTIKHKNGAYYLYDTILDSTRMIVYKETKTIKCVCGTISM